jgi:S1-C subfamily serine protease
MQLVSDSIRVPVLGVTMGEVQGGGAHVVSVAPGSTAEVAGVQPGDQLMSVGEIPGDAPGLAEHLQARYGNESKMMIPIVVTRGGRQLSLVAPLDFTWRVERRIGPLPGASARALRIRAGILHGTTG